MCIQRTHLAVCVSSLFILLGATGVRAVAAQGYTIPDGHPRILLNATVRARLSASLAQARPRAVRFRDMVDGQLAGDDVYAFEGWFAALMYQLTGNVAYGQYAVDRVEAGVASEEALIASGQAAEVSFDSYLYVGDTIGDLAMVYDWCYELLTPAQRTRWRAYANQAVWNVWHHSQAEWGGVSHPWSGWSVDNPANNNYYSFLRATMLLGLAEYGDDPAGADWVTMFRVTKIQNQLVPVFAQDLAGGGSREGTGYGTSHRHLFTLYDWWEQTTGEEIHSLTSHARLSLANFIHLMVPTLEWLAPIGDHARESTAALFDYHRQYVEVLTYLYRDDPLAPYGKWFLNHCSVPEMEQGFNYVFDFLYDDPAIPEASLEGLTPAYHAPGIGRVYARSSWQANATWINLMAGPYTESHAHQDQGSLMLYHNEWLLDDQNRRSHSGIRQEVTMHNLPRIDQGGSPIEMDYGASSVLVALDHQPTHTYMAVDVSPMYSGSADVARVEREMVFLPPSILVVFDRVEGASNTTRVWQLSSPITPTVAGPITTFAGQTTTLAVRRILPASPTVTVLNWATLDSDMLGGARLDVSESGAGGVSRFLHVFSLDGAVTSASADDSGTLRGVTMALSAGGSATVRFQNDSWGGTLQTFGSGGAPMLDVALVPGVETLPLFAGPAEPSLTVDDVATAETDSGTSTLSFSVTLTP